MRLPTSRVTIQLTLTFSISWWLGNIASGGTLTYVFWRSAYISMCFSWRNRTLVIVDWMKSKIFGRDVSRE